MANTDCLIDIVGISRKDCSCLEQDLEIPAEGETPADNEWYKKSTSGFYVDELEGVVSIDTVKDVVSCQGLPDYFKTKIANSIRDVADDVSAQISERYTKKESNYVGFIGSKISGKALSLVATGYAGMKINISNPKAGGVIVLHGIGMLLNTTSEFNVFIYRRYVDLNLFELVDTIEGVNSTANGYTENTFEDKILLPMEIDNEGDIEYYFLYELNGMSPRDNLASCGCGRRERTLKSIIDYSGVSGDVLEEMGYWNSSSYANGIALDAEIRCNSEELICKMFNASGEWAKYIAHAVLFKMGWRMGKDVISTNKITQETMSNREGVEANILEFDSEYWTRIRWLAQNVNIELNDCYSCNNRKLKVQQILL